jgi:CheY-like chemotaxis protein/two-component sensor histidine kinase
MSKIESGKLELDSSDFDFKMMMRRVIDISGFAIKSHEQSFDIKVDDHIPRYLRGDAQRLAQIFTNLLSNATKFTAKGGHIQLRCTLDNPTSASADGFYRLKASVTDNGIGISSEQLSRLFKPFMQADNTTSRRYGGTGLGLAISRQIAEMMGGYIKVTSELGRGSIFSFVVKLKPACSTPAELAAVAETKANAVLNDDFSAYTILLVEDMDINREIVTALLESTGIKIVEAVDGVDAVRAYSKDPQHFDLIFMDIQMPQMDGYEATRKIRALAPHVPAAATVPIIAMTANVFADDVDKCLAAGMNDHVGKPLDINVLHEMLRSYLPQRPELSMACKAMYHKAIDPGRVKSPA